MTYWLCDVTILLSCVAGSANAANCAELAKKEDIDGFLVGGASLKVWQINLRSLYIISFVL